jgi:DNA-binding protein H-NS
MHSRSSESPEWPPEKIAAARTIQRLMAFWQIQPSELASIEAQPAPSPAPAAPTRPRYRHPVSGETWDGEGSQPQWLRHALLKEGYLVEELRLPADAALDPADTAPAAADSTLG